MTKIVIADDHRVVRSGLRMLLNRQDGFEVVAEAGDVADARRYVRAHRPDVLMLDLNMPGDASLPAIPSFREESPTTRVVVLTMQEDPAFAREALQAGASGYVLKEAADEELVQAVRAAADGGTFLDPQLGARIAAAPPQLAQDVDGRSAAALGARGVRAAGRRRARSAPLRATRTARRPVHPRRPRRLFPRRGGSLPRPPRFNARPRRRGDPTSRGRVADQPSRTGTALGRAQPARPRPRAAGSPREQRAVDLLERAEPLARRLGMRSVTAQAVGARSAISA
jgi:two-component system response regulator NreC